jgi:hypothetical protein
VILKKDFVIGDSVVWDMFHLLWNQALKLIWSKTITAEFKYFDMHHKTATIFTLVLWVKMSQNVQEMHLTVSSFFRSFTNKTGKNDFDMYRETMTTTVHMLHSTALFAWLISHQPYFSLRTNQPLATNQQYFSLRTNQHQPSATSQTNRLYVPMVNF